MRAQHEYKMKRARSSRGILLVEALVSFSILLLASVMFYGLMASTHRAEAQAHKVMAANAYARQLMEGQRLKGFSSLTAGTTNSRRDLASDRGGRSRTTPLIAKTTVYEGPGAGVRSIVVEVSWPEGRVQLESYVTE